MAILLVGCASDSSTSLDPGTDTSPIAISSALEGEIGSPLGGADGLTFRIRGSNSDDLFYWTVTGEIPAELTRLPLNDSVPSSIPSNTFALRGSPTACRPFTIQVTVHTFPDRSVLVAPTLFTIAIGQRNPDLCPPPTISTDSLTMFRDVRSDVAITVTGGKPEFKWSATFPPGLTPGLSIDPSTGVISGTPPTPGNFSVPVTVVDSAGRSAGKTIPLGVRAFNLADAKGTWSGIVRSGTLVLGSTGNFTYEPLTGANKRLSLLITGDSNTPPQVAPLSSGTLDRVVLNPQSVAFSLTPGGGYPELFNGRIDQLNIHLGCTILFAGQVNLECVGHSLLGPQYDVAVTLTRVSGVDQDSAAPALVSSVPAAGASSATFFEATLTFNEPMSSSSSASISGNAVIRPIVFLNPTTAVVPLFGLRSNTSYTLTLNPGSASGPGRFMDVAGNPLPEASTTFTTGVLAPAQLTINKAGTGSGTVTSDLPGILCGDSCSADYSRGTTVTLTARPDETSRFVGWSGSACSGVATCTATLRSDATVTATFEPLPRYTLTVNIAGTGTVEAEGTQLVCTVPQCSWEFVSGTTVALTATPGTGFTFGSWGGACSTNGTCNVIMGSDKTANVTFAAIPNYRLTVAKNGSGTVTSSPNALINCGPVCSADVASGTNITLTATPDSGFTFTSWSGAACSGTGSCNVTVDAVKTITATFTAIPTYRLTILKNGSGTVTSSGSTINCGTVCVADFASGANVSLTAAPASGFTFTGWSGASCPGTGSCNVLMDAAKTVTATFTPIPSYRLTVIKNGSGTVSSSPSGIDCGGTCSADFQSPSSVTLNAQPADGFSFTGWSGDCAGSAACQLTMNSDLNVTATFTAKPKYQISVSIGGTGGGSVVSAPAGINCTASCSSDFSQGDNVTLTATQASGSVFAGWGGACTGTGQCLITVSAATSVTATFNVQTYRLTVTKNGSGTGTVTSNPGGITCGGVCAADFVTPTSVTLAAVADSGSAFTGWTGACTGTGGCAVTMNAARTVNATFNLIFPLTVTVSGSGTVSSSPSGITNCSTSCTANFAGGTNVTLSATALSGFVFTGWSGPCSGTGACVIAMSMAQSVTATFVAQNYLLTVDRDGTGTGTVTSNPPGIFCGTTCSQTYPSGTSVILTAVPDSGVIFVGWSGGGCTGIGSCTVQMTTAKNVTATFNTQTGVIAFGQTFTFNKRSTTASPTKFRHAITLTGSAPGGGPLTFQITRFPAHQDPNQSMNLVSGLTYQFVNPITGSLTETTATTSSTVNLSTGAVTGAPVIVFSPKTCVIDPFVQDSFEFVAMDSIGNTSPPATVTMNASSTTCVN